MSGLEAFGVAVSILEVAEIGLKLSKTIYNYADSVASADDRIARIAKNVNLTTEVVRRVAEVFEAQGEVEDEPGGKAGGRKRIVNQEALRLGMDVAGECEVVFGRLMAEVGRLKGNSWRQYKFPFKESKFALWEAQLEKLKTTLNCLMNVLILAQALKENKDSPRWAEVERLAHERDEATKKYEALKKAIEDAPDENDSSSITNIQTTVPPPPRYDQIDGSRSPGQEKKSTPPMRDLEDCIPRVQAMLDTINEVQQTLGNQSRDYIAKEEIRTLWEVYWSMNDKMVDSLRKLESARKGTRPSPNPAGQVQMHYPSTDEDTYTEIISQPITFETETRTYSTPATFLQPENRTTFSDEVVLPEETFTEEVIYPKERRIGSPSRRDRIQPQLAPESRSWEGPPVEFKREERVIRTPSRIPRARPAGEGEISEPKKPGESPEEKKGDVVEGLLKEWTTVYD